MYEDSVAELRADEPCVNKMATNNRLMDGIHPLWLVPSPLGDGGCCPSNTHF